MCTKKQWKSTLDTATVASKATTCRCPSYSWPHRRGGGACIWNPVHEELLCRECGQPCFKRFLTRVLAEDEAAPEAVCSHCCGAPIVLRGRELRAEDA